MALGKIRRNVVSERTADTLRDILKCELLGGGGNMQNSDKGKKKHHISIVLQIIQFLSQEEIIYF